MINQTSTYGIRELVHLLQHASDQLKPSVLQTDQVMTSYKRTSILQTDQTSSTLQLKSMQ